MIDNRETKKPPVSAFLTKWEISEEYNMHYMYLTDAGVGESGDMPVVDYTDDEIAKIARDFAVTEPFYKAAINSHDEDCKTLIEISQRYFTLVMTHTQVFIKTYPFYRNVYDQPPIMLANRDFLTADSVFLELFDRVKAKQVSKEVQKHFLTFLNAIDQVSRMTRATRTAFEILSVRAEPGVREMLAHERGGFSIRNSYNMWQNVPFVQPNTVH